MPAGTWNLGRLRKRVDYVGLKDLGISIIDNTANSSQYFNVVEFPNTLTGGKNLFKIKSTAGTLVKDSKIHIEVLDSNGSPIYYEPINYLEADGTRVIAIYIYPDTPYGTATVYIAGRARVNASNGRRLRFSRNVNDRDYINFPNVLWSKTVTIAPERLNSTEIIFTRKPKLTLTEVVQPYLQPVNLTNVATQSMGVGTCIIKPKPQSTSTSTTPIKITGLASMPALPVAQGAFAKNTPASYFGSQISAAPAALEMASTKGQSTNISLTVGPTSATTTTIVTALDESIFETSEPFFTTDMSNGDVITIVNPNIETKEIGAKLDVNGRLVPKSQASEGSTSAGANTIFQLSGSYHFVIDNIITTKKAHVVLLPEPEGFKNASDSNTGGKWEVTLNGNPNANASKDGPQTSNPGAAQIIDEVKATANYTCSYVLPFVTIDTEQSQSYAEIKIGDIEPATGDVYKLKTFYKAGGAFGDFIDAGETILEQIEILEDTGSFEGTPLTGMEYNRIGFFSSLDDYQTYWTASGGSIPPIVELTETFEPDDLMSGIRLTPATDFPLAGFSYIRTKDQYRPKLTKDTQYLLTINAYADMSASAVDPLVGGKAQMDIYISGSSGKVQADELTQNAYILDPFSTYENSLYSGYADGGFFGTRVGSIQLTESSSLTPAVFRFNSVDDQQVDLYLVIRNGRWNVGNISLKTFNESKFTPNFTRVNTRIPTQFLKTPLTFKILFFDYLNNQAETEALIYPVTFTGENTVIAGGNNLLTGSVYIGNSVGSGIELAGVNSGFIRSIGYEGFTSASRTDQPGGFMMYTGSVLPNTPDGYNGVGLEIVQDSGSFFRFSTGTKPGLEIKTPTFFLGDENTQISGSNGRIKISGSNLDLNADTFFLGGAGQFVSGANGNIEISSSDFHLNNQGQVIMQGTITAEAGGTIGGFTIGTDTLNTTDFSLDAGNRQISLGAGNNIVILNANSGMWLGHATQTSAPFSVNLQGALTASSGTIGGFELSNASISASDGGLVLRSGGQITGSKVLFDGGKIAGWSITDNYLFSIAGSGGVKLDASNKVLTFRTGSAADTEIIKIGQVDTGKFGIQGLDLTGNEIFKLGEDGNEIAGWTINQNELRGDQMIIRKDGTIESANFASDVAGSGFRLTALNGGFLEVENARIRGTLSTAVFEKEAVNAVGGQLYVANSSVLTGSAIAPGGIHTATTTTMSLENVSGFVAGEILTAKKVSDTGFATEYIKVVSESRFDKASDTNFAGYLYVERGYSGSASHPGDGGSGSLGDLASNAQSYSGSQVIVSTGRIGTGYIRLNANPSDPYTPYIDIVERTGSAIYDIDLKVRLGDLSGLSSARLHGTNPAGQFGLYSKNVFLEGGIVARTGSIGGIEMRAGKLFTGDGVHEGATTGFYIDSSSNFSLGDKLTWDGTNLVVKGQLQLASGENVGSGMVWSGSWEESKTYFKSDAVEYSGSSYIAIGPASHVSSLSNRPPQAAATWSLMASTGSDGIIGANAKSLTLSTDSNVFAFDNSSDSSATPTSIRFVINTQNLGSDVDTNSIVIKDAGGSTISNPSLSSSLSSGTGVVTGSITFAGTLGGDKNKLPVTITVTEDDLSDSTTIHKVQGGTDGSPGTNAKLLSLEASTLTFVKAIDGTITPATASITASLQNTTSATASYSTTPTVTLNTGSLLDLTRMELTKDNFGTNTSVKVTATGDSGAVSDSVTFVLLDEGTGNIQSILSNPSHTVQAANNESVSSFIGAGTTLQVFEGATPLTYESTAADLSSGEFSASISGINVTPGSFTGDGTNNAILSIPTGMSETSGAIHFTVTGFTQNNTAFTSSVTQSFAKSVAGAQGATGSPSKGVIVNGTTLIFTKDIAGVITPESASFTASTNNTTDDGAWSNVGGTLSNTDNAINGASDPPTCIVTRDNFVDGMKVTYTLAAADDSFADSVTLKLIDAGSGNVQSVVSNQSHVYQADSSGTVSDYAGGGTTIQVYEGATLLTYNNSSTIAAGKFSASFNDTNIDAGTISGNNTTTLVFDDPNNMNQNSAEIHITLAGKTQNGTAFTLPVTQSFAKSVAGTTAKTVVVSPDSFFFVKAIDGQYTPSSITISGSGQNLTANGSWSESAGTLTNKVTSANSNSCKITSANFVDGMVVTFTTHGDDGSLTDSVTIKELDEGSGNTQIILSNPTHIFQADHTGSINNFAGGGTTIEVFEGSTLLTYKGTGTLSAGQYSASFVAHNITPGTLLGSLTTKGTFFAPTAMSADTAELRIEISGSTQNGTSFILPVTQSFAKSIAGAEPIVANQTNASHTFVGDTSGVPTSYEGSGTTISVFEGIAQLQGVENSSAPGPGEFIVVPVGDNITVGADSVSGKNIVIADHSNATEKSGSISHVIAGETLGGTGFGRTLTQNFSVTTQGTDGTNAKTLILTTDSNVFAFDNAADSSATPAAIEFIASAQNLSSTTDTNSIVIKDASGTTISNPSLSSSISSGTGVVTGSITFAGTLGGDKNKLPITITVTEDGLSDSTTIHKVQGGEAGSSGASAKLLSLEASTLTFVKAQDGTVTPATASITASLQNTTSATASYSTTPTVTLLTGSKLDLTRMELTKDNFGTNSTVRVTANGDSGAVSDSVTFVLLDEGSGAVTGFLTNPSHVLPASSDGTVSSHAGSGTDIRVFEGATALTFTTGTPASGEFAVSVGNTANITEGGLSGNGTTTATVAIHSGAAQGTDEFIITYTITGKTANGTDFSQISLDQSLVKSKAGATAKTVVVTPDHYFFTKAIDGTITPSKITISGSGQNLTANGTWTLDNGSNSVTNANSNKVELFSNNFVDPHVVTFTAHGDDGGISDSITLRLLDEGSGNVQTIISNTNHTFKSDYLGNVPTESFDGDTTIHVFEGATKIPFTASLASSSLALSASIYTNSALPFNWLHAPSGSNPAGLTSAYYDNATDNGLQREQAIDFHEGPFGEQELCWECWPDYKDNADGGWNSSFFDIDKTCSYMYVAYTKRLIHQNSGSFYWGTHNGDAGGSAISASKPVAKGYYSGDLNYDGTGVSSNIYFQTGDSQPVIDRWYMTVGFMYKSGSHHYRSEYDGIDGRGGTWDLVTKQRVYPGTPYAFNKDSATSRHRHYHYYNRLGGYPDGPGTTSGTDSASLAASGSSHTQLWQIMALPAVYKMDGGHPSVDMLLAGHRITNETEQGKRVDVRIHGLNTGSAQLTVFTTGSTQNQTAFDQQSNTLSYNKAPAGSEPITIVLDNEAHTLVGDTAGTPVTYVGSGTTVSVFEGATQLQGIDDSGTPTTGQFEVARSGDNITPGSDSVDGLNVVIGDHGSANETSGSITYTITGKTLAGVDFTRTKIQSFTVTTQGSSAKTVVVSPDSFFFVKAQDGTLTPASITISGSGQNLTANGAWTETAGTLTNEVVSGNNNSCKVTSNNFVDGMKVTFTAHGNDGSITDSVTLKQLDEGSGNIQAVQTNGAHNYPANSSNVISSFTGGENAIRVFEGATELNSVASSPGNGEYSITTTDTNITVGTKGVTGNPTTFTAPSSMTAASAQINYSIAGKTQNGTAFTTALTQSFTRTSEGSTGATGATGPTFPFLTGSLGTIDTTGGIAPGLIMTGGVFGFHGSIAAGGGTNAKLSDFTSFLDDSGNFYLGSGSGDLGAGYFAWNNANKTLLMSGSGVDVRADKFYLGRQGQYISGSGGNIEISSSNFHLQPDGDVVIRGDITVTNPSDFGQQTTALPFGLNGTMEADQSGEIIGWVGQKNSSEPYRNGVYHSGSSVTQAYNYVNVVYESGSNNSNCLEFDYNGNTGEIWTYAREAFAVNTSHTYRMTARYKLVSSAGSDTSQDFHLGFACMDANYNWINSGAGTHRYFVAKGNISTHNPDNMDYDWNIVQGTITGEGSGANDHHKFKPGTVAVRPMFIFGYNNGDGKFLMDYIFLENLTTGETSRIDRRNDAGLVFVNNAADNNDPPGNNPGEIFPHGHDLSTGTPSKFASGSIYYKGGIYNLPLRTNTLLGTDNSNVDDGYIVFDTRNANDRKNPHYNDRPGFYTFTSTTSSISLAKLNGTQWQRDTNGAFTNFTPNINHCIIGRYKSANGVSVYESIVDYGAVSCSIDFTASLKENGTLAYSNPFVGSYTSIQGGQIKTGKVVSTNFSTTAGSELNLDAGTITLGGSSDPDFAVSATGDLTASNALFDGYAAAKALRTIPITITSGNSPNFCVASTTSQGTTVTTIYLDGSVNSGATNGVPNTYPDRVTSHIILNLNCKETSGDVGAVLNIVPPQLPGGESVQVTMEVATGKTVELCIEQNNSTTAFGYSYAASQAVANATRSV